MVAKTLVIAGAALLAAFAAAGPAAAQQRGAPRGGPDGSVLFNMLDKNHDGVVDKSEVDAAAEAALARADRNNDGKLSQDEIAGAARNAAKRAFDLFAFGLNRNATPGTGFDNRGRGPVPQWFNNRRGPPGFTGPFNGRGFPPRFAPRGPQFNQPFGPQQGQNRPRFAPRAPQFNQPFGPQQGQNGPRFAPRGPQFNQPLGPQQGPNGPAPRNRNNRNPQGGPQAPNAPLAVPTQPTPPPAPGGGPPPGNDGRTPAFNALDTNHDGVISPDEFNALRNRLLPSAGGGGNGVHL